MRNIQSGRARLSITLLITSLLVLLAGCGGKEITNGGAGTGAVPSTAASITLSSIGTKVKSDGSDSLSITATVLDSSNATLAGQALTISSTGGQLSASSALTDAAGKATFTISGGGAGINDTIIVTVAATGSSASKTLPIQISGSTLTLTSTTASVASGTALPIAISANDAGANGVASQALRYSIDTTSTGSGILNTSTATTNSAGTASVTLTGANPGNVVVKVEWLNAANTVTATATKTVTVTAGGGAFAVTTPATSPFGVNIGTNQNVVVSVPTTIGGTAVAFIRYATSLGNWLSAGNPKVLTIARTAATNTQTFVPGNSAGNASVQVDALDATGAVITSTSFTFLISAPSSTAATINLQSNVSVLQPSVGTNLSTATFTALVKDNAANPNPVGGANVLFELINTTGTGESISPVVVTTGADGQAQTTFTAGTSPTTQGAAVRATILNTTPAIFAEAPITVGGQATSVSLGASTHIAINPDNTAYMLPVTVMVSDSSGARVSGAVVSLSLWPVQYYKGSRDAGCKVSGSGPFLNEDINSNLILDADEDIDGPGAMRIYADTTVVPNIAPVWGYPWGFSKTATVTPATPAAASIYADTTTYPNGYLGDGTLWPAPSTAGTIPSTVTTGVDGTATFTWTYLKQYADWVDARIRATLQVQGSQATTNIVLNLVPAASDIKAPCSLPPSPFN